MLVALGMGLHLSGVMKVSRNYISHRKRIDGSLDYHHTMNYGGDMIPNLQASWS
jgi:hypothetical protein